MRILALFRMSHVRAATESKLVDPLLQVDGLLKSAQKFLAEWFQTWIDWRYRLAQSAKFETASQIVLATQVRMMTNTRMDQLNLRMQAVGYLLRQQFEFQM